MYNCVHEMQLRYPAPEAVVSACWLVGTGWWRRCEVLCGRRAPVHPGLSGTVGTRRLLIGLFEFKFDSIVRTEKLAVFYR
jgi:hypothetical protein